MRGGGARSDEDRAVSSPAPSEMPYALLTDAPHSVRASAPCASFCVSTAFVAASATGTSAAPHSRRSMTWSAVRVHLEKGAKQGTRHEGHSQWVHEEEKKRGVRSTAQARLRQKEGKNALDGKEPSPFPRSSLSLSPAKRCRGGGG